MHLNIIGLNLFFVITIITPQFLNGFSIIDMKNSNDLETCVEVKELSRAIIYQATVLEDPSQISIFYSVEDGHMIKNMMPRPWIRPGQTLRLPFIGDPCSCGNLSCGCCVGINITTIRFDKELCVNVTFDPSIIGIIVDASVNNQSVLHNVFSVSNPPPICIPLVISGVPTGIDFCLRLYQIALSGYNIRVCIDLEVRIVTAPILVLHFDCVKLGLDGVSIVKPNSTTVRPSDENPDNQMTTSGQTDGDVFDPVTETETPDTTQTISDINKSNMSASAVDVISESIETNMGQNQQTQTIEIGETSTQVMQLINVNTATNNQQLNSNGGNNINEPMMQSNETLGTIVNYTDPTIISENIVNMVQNIMNQTIYVNSSSSEEPIMISETNNVINVTSVEDYNTALNLIISNFTNLSQNVSIADRSNKLVGL